MGSLLSSIRDEHHAFEAWCESLGYSTPQREYWDHPKFKEYEDCLDPPEQREAINKKHVEYMESFREKVGVLSLTNWYGADLTEDRCPKCSTNMIVKGGFILTPEYGCPKCGHTEGGEY